MTASLYLEKESLMHEENELAIRQEPNITLAYPVPLFFFQTIATDIHLCFSQAKDLSFLI